MSAAAQASDVRQRLFDLIGAYPGLHLRELARQASLSEALAGYHVRRLVEERVVQGVDDGHYLRLFRLSGARPSDPDQAIIALLRQRIPLQLVLHLMGRSPATHGELASAAGLSKSTASYHIAKLVAAGLLVAADGGPGFALAERAHLMHLLDRWRPPAALVDGFDATWAGLYRKRGRK